MVFGLFQSPAKVEGAERIFGSVYLISTKTLFEQTISKQPDPGAFHVYLGYAGWNMSQLRKEVELGAWFIFQGDAKTVFDAQPDSLWPRLIEKTELQFAHKLAGVEHRFSPKRLRKNLSCASRPMVDVVSGALPEFC
jgi:putative AlgH/UPF0301 family transcriptional regulator